MLMWKQEMPRLPLVIEVFMILREWLSTFVPISKNAKIFISQGGPKDIIRESIESSRASQAHLVNWELPTIITHDY